MNREKSAMLYIFTVGVEITLPWKPSSVIGPGKVIDTNKFYVISPTALGTVIFAHLALEWG